MTRFQVVEVPGGFAVKDTRDGSIWTKTYKTLSGVIAKARALQQAHGNRRYF